MKVGKKWKLFNKNFEDVLAKTYRKLIQTLKFYLNKSGLFLFHYHILMDKYVGEVIDLEIII